MSPSTASTAMITRGMLKTGSRFTGGSDGTARSYAASRFSARQVGQKEKGGLSPSLSRVAGVLPPLTGWSHPIASPRLSIKTERQDLHRLSHMDERTLTGRIHRANRALVLTLIAVPPPPYIEASREQAHELVAAVVDENVGVVAGVLGRTEQGAEIDLELLLLPLASTAGRAFVR